MKISDTRATTLAARSLRTILALIAAFNLKTIQFDAINAFINSKIDQETYIEYPPGYGCKGKVLKLNKALYGLRQSPLLWQKELIYTLIQLGLIPIPKDPCLFANDFLIIIVFVDDIIVLFYQEN